MKYPLLVLVFVTLVSFISLTSFEAEGTSLENDAIVDFDKLRQWQHRPTPLIQAATGNQADLIVYVPDWVSPMPSFGFIEAMAEQGIAATNQAFSDSQIDLELRLVGVLPVTLEPSMDSSALLTEFANNQSVNAALSRYYGADLALLFVPSMSDAAGIAFLPGNHSVVSYSGFPDQIRNAIFSHEIGHNFGAGHEGVATSLADYGHAIDCGFGVTVMWSTVSPGTLNSFSNPNLSSPIGCGDAAAADNARVLRESTSFITNTNAANTPQGSVEFEQTSQSVMEGNAVEVALTRDDFSGPAAVTVALNRDDGSSALFAVNFDAGEQEASLFFTVDGDGQVGDRLWRLQLHYPSGASLGANQQLSLVVSDSGDDQQPGRIEFGQDDYLVTAGQVLPVTLVRLGGSQGPLSVRLQTQDGSAVAGQDYTAVNQQVTFADGQMNLTTNISTALSGANRDFVLQLIAADGSVESARVVLGEPVTPTDSGGDGGGGGSLGWAVMLLAWMGYRRRRPLS
ncbi:Calx-beta domain-containing protein [Ferrimonas aestuarii]|uniref:Calx-beta domain-containing protein n=1 Tax=Ferrimonas aestuarii TaxID=2569539 RepID=A0A4U1BXX5_9GAMM|nr:Calx-beta domain-containing protein [Ferrimonas aestuarii]TKB58585.1 hypothetical protein FCL42_02220 [Ferrimonas aestuarii]